MTTQNDHAEKSRAKRMLYIIRGLPGAGKGSLAQTVAPEACFSSEDFFRVCGEYKFRKDQLALAKRHCLQQCTEAMSQGSPTVAVYDVFSNTCAVRPYLKAAEAHNYTVSIIECQTQTTRNRKVSQRTISKIRKRWEYIAI